MHLGLVCFLTLQLLLRFSFLQDSVKLIFTMKFQFVRVFFFFFFFSKYYNQSLSQLN